MISELLTINEVLELDSSIIVGRIVYQRLVCAILICSKTRARVRKLKSKKKPKATRSRNIANDAILIVLAIVENKEEEEIEEDEDNIIYKLESLLSLLNFHVGLYYS